MKTDAVLRFLPLAALLTLLYGCALTPSQIGDLTKPDEGLAVHDNRSGFVSRKGDLNKPTERITLLPMADGSPSSIVIQKQGEDPVVLDQPYTQARMEKDKVVTAATSNSATNNRYIDTMAALPVRTFKDMVRLSVLANPEVQARWQNIRISRYQRNEGFSRFLPSIDFFGAIRTERLRRDDGIHDLTGHRTATILTQNLFEGFSAMNDTRLADYLVKSRFYDLLDISEFTAYEAVRAHSDVQRYTRLVELAGENLQAHQEVYSQISERTKAGVDRRVDLELATGRLALAQSNLATEQANLHDVSARYIRIVGQRPVPLSGGLPKNLAQKAPASLADGVKQALRDAPAIRSAVEAMHAAQMAEYSHNGAFLPKVDWVLQFTSANDYAGVPGVHPEKAIGVLMNWNLYRGHADVNRREQLQQLVSAARQDHETVCRKVRYDFEQAYNEYHKLREQLAYLENYQNATDRALQAYRQQFTIGQRTLLDLLDSQNEYFESQRDYLNTDFQLQLAAARLQQVMGRLLESLKVASLVDEAPEAALKEREGVAELQCDDSLFVQPVKVDKDALVAQAMKERPLRKVNAPAQ